MYINKKQLQWNPWDTDIDEVKRPCHIRGMQKMDEYERIRTRQQAEKHKAQQGMQSQLGKLGRGGGRGGGAYSKEFAKLKYRDPDMKQLAEQRKGTTSSYDYTRG